jgi:hypothetical protein
MRTLFKALSKTLPVLLVWLFAPSAILAQTQPAAGAASSQNDQTQQLLNRLQELEKQVAELKSQATAAPAPAVEPAPEPPAVNEVNPRLKLNVFGDVGFEANDKKGNVSNTFEIGSLDLFMTSRLSDRFSLLGELLFISSEDNTISPDVERLLLQYKQNDYFAIGVGRYHTSIGYYNTAFHQGAGLRPPSAARSCMRLTTKAASCRYKRSERPPTVESLPASWD